MPIEFRCGQCGKLLRTGDDTAGKQAKCPSCGSIQAIPMFSSPLGSPAEPTPNAPPPPPDSPFDDAVPSPFGPVPIPSGLDPNPYASPSPGAASFEFRGPSGPRSGPPWERDGASFNSFVATLKEFYGSANLFFDNMRREGGLGAPIGYLVAGGTVGGLGGFCLQIAIQMLLGMGMGNGPPFGPQMAGGAIGGAAGLVCVAIFLPLALIFGLFVTAGIYHLMLTMLGGARFPFETTVRVIAYSQGSTSLISLIPFCGGLINAIVNLVYTIVGLSRAHEISGGKAAAAVLIPFFICCGLGVALYAAIIFAVMNQANR